MNIMKCISLVQCLIAEGEENQIIKDVKHIAIKTINEEHNCGYDRANITMIAIFDNLTAYAKEREIL